MEQTHETKVAHINAIKDAISKEEEAIQVLRYNADYYEKQKKELAEQIEVIKSGAGQ
jgi:hypothetical protein